MEQKQIDIFGNDAEPVPEIKKGRPKYASMQYLHGIIEDKTCKTCRHCIGHDYHGRTYHKCELWIISNSSATDIRLKSKACGKYEEQIMKTKEIKAYAIQLNAMETVSKTKEFKELTEGSLGVNPDFPFAYVLYRTHEDRMKAFEELSKVFDYCKVVENAAYIPEPRGN